MPEGLTPADIAGPVENLEDGVDHPTVALAIAQAAHHPNALREDWLNPAEWVERVPEVVCQAIPTASSPSPATRRT